MSYVIDPERRMLEVTIEGVFTAADMATYLALRDNDPAYTPALDVFIDARKVTSIMPASAVRYFATEARLQPRVPSWRAIVASDDHVYGSARMFQAHVEGSGAEYRGFRDEDAARAWIAECRSRARATAVRPVTPAPEPGREAALAP